jgi:hypothetical protein
MHQPLGFKGIFKLRRNFCCTFLCTRRWDTFRLDGLGSVPGVGERFFSSPQRPASCPSVTGALHSGRKLNTLLHQRQRPILVKLYLHSPVCVYGVAFN